MATTCIAQPDGTSLCLNQTAPSCIPPLIWKCHSFLEGVQSCACEPLVVAPPPAATTACSLAISYPPGDPAAAALTGDSGCAGAELALAVILAKILGAK